MLRVLPGAFMAIVLLGVPRGIQGQASASNPRSGTERGLERGLDPEEATRAYLAKMAPEKKKQSDAYFEGGYWLRLWEFLYGVVVAWLLLRWRRRHVADAVVLGRYLVLAGSIRFAIEFIRVNARIVGPLTLAHVVSLALVIIGATILARRPREA